MCRGRGKGRCLWVYELMGLRDVGRSSAFPTRSITHSLLGSDRSISTQLTSQSSSGQLKISALKIQHSRHSSLSAQHQSSVQPPSLPSPRTYIHYSTTQSNCSCMPCRTYVTLSPPLPPSPSNLITISLLLLLWPMTCYTKCPFISSSHLSL